MPPLFMKQMEVIIGEDTNARVRKTSGEDDAFLQDENDENAFLTRTADSASITFSVLSSDEENSSNTSVISGNKAIPTSELDILEDLIEVRDWDALLHFAGDVLDHQKDQDDSVTSQWSSSHSEESFSPDEPTPSHPTAYNDDNEDNDDDDGSYETFPFRKRKRSENQCCQWPLLYRLFEGVSNKNILILQPSDDKYSDSSTSLVEIGPSICGLE